MTREASVSELTGAGDDQEIAKHEIICNIMIMYFDGHSQSETLRTSDLYLPSGNQTLLAGKSTIKWHLTAKIIELNGKCSMFGK